MDMSFSNAYRILMKDLQMKPYKNRYWRMSIKLSGKNSPIRREKEETMRILFSDEKMTGSITMKMIVYGPLIGRKQIGEVKKKNSKETFHKKWWYGQRALHPLFYLKKALSIIIVTSRKYSTSKLRVRARVRMRLTIGMTLTLNLTLTPKLVRTYTHIGTVYKKIKYPNTAFKVLQESTNSKSLLKWSSRDVLSLIVFIFRYSQTLKYCRKITFCENKCLNFCCTNLRYVRTCLLHWEKRQIKIDVL